MDFSFDVNLHAQQHPLNWLTPLVHFTFDKALAASSLDTTTGEVLCVVLPALPAYSLFEFLLALRRTSKVFWKLFFSAKGLNVPLPPAL